MFAEVTQALNPTARRIEVGRVAEARDKLIQRPLVAGLSHVRMRRACVLACGRERAWYRRY